jgi:hypothetical protein
MLALPPPVTQAVFGGPPGAALRQPDPAIAARILADGVGSADDGRAQPKRRALG